VNELINPHTGQWDEILVRDTFWEMDANIILSTPIRDDFEDFPAWHHDNKGLFSVKSAYKVYVKLRDAERSVSSGNVEENAYWRQIWDLPCLPKIKQFVWRLAHNSLPLMTNINRRGIECDTLCVCCKRLDEDGAHLFLKCKEIKELWRSIGMEAMRDQLSTHETAQSVVQGILSLNDDQKVLIFCMLWRWWLRRNKQNSEGKVVPIGEVLRQAKYWTQESLQFCKREKEAPVPRPILQWQKPGSDTLKVNFDGSYHANTRHGGWGFVIRDEFGVVRGAGAGRLQYLGSALQAEIEACSEAVQAAVVWGMGRIQLETDSLILAKALESKAYDLAPEGVMLRDIRSFLQLNFIQVNVVHVNRMCNGVAHTLATYGASQQQVRLLWPDEVPDIVNVLVASESAEPV
jgi:hypothetical protein